MARTYSERTDRPLTALDQADDTSPGALGAAFHSGQPPFVRIDIKSEKLDQGHQPPPGRLVTTAFVVRHGTLGDADAVAQLTLR